MKLNERVSTWEQKDKDTDVNMVEGTTFLHSDNYCVVHLSSPLLKAVLNARSCLPIVIDHPLMH